MKSIQIPPILHGGEIPINGMTQIEALMYVSYCHIFDDKKHLRITDQEGYTLCILPYSDRYPRKHMIHFGRRVHQAMEEFLNSDDGCYPDKLICNWRVVLRRLIDTYGPLDDIKYY